MQNLDALADYLKATARSAFDYLKKESDSVLEIDARRYASSNWPLQRFGIGQDGSISGIVYHVASWKVLTLPMFSQNGTMMEMSVFDALPKPPVEEYGAVRRWLAEAGENWDRALAALPAASLTEVRYWGSAEIPLTGYIEEMTRHDIQHAAQIEYLKQRILCESAV